MRFQHLGIQTFTFLILFIFVKCNYATGHDSSKYRSSFYESQLNPLSNTNKQYTSPKSSISTRAINEPIKNANPYLSKSFSNIPYTNNSYVGRLQSNAQLNSPSNLQSNSQSNLQSNSQSNSQLNAQPSSHYSSNTLPSVINVHPKPIVYNKPNSEYSTRPTYTTTTTTTTTTAAPIQNIDSYDKSNANYEVTNLDSAYSSSGPTVYNTSFNYKCEYNEQPRIPSLGDLQRDMSIVAKIHKSGFQGYVLLTPEQASTSAANSGYLNQENILIRVHITNSRTQGLPIKEAFSWRIYNQHSIDSNGACALFLNSDDLLHDLTINFGPIITGKQQEFSNEEFTNSIYQSLPIGKQAKQNLNSLLGKTLMLIGAESGIKICSTLLPAGIKHVYEAKLHHPIAGRFKILQADGSNQAAILTEYLMYSNGERKESKHKWQIVDASNSQPLDYKHNHERIFTERYLNEKNHCADLKGKFVLGANEINEYNQMIVNTEMPTLRGKSSHTVTTIRPLSSFNSLYLIVYESYNSDKILSCSPITLKRPVIASATFKYPPVFGTISFSQETPLDPTNVHINLNFTSPSVYFYGIDSLPSIKRRKPEMKKCPNIKETIFNPLRLDVENIPFEGQGTTDQYASGDLSGKFCSISYPPQATNNYKPESNVPIKTLNLHSVDYNLPLFGKNSIVGRALVFYDLEGNAVQCANIELLGGMINTAYATFDQPIQGQFIFRQASNYCDDEVFVYVEISKPDTLNSVRTDNHAWHIHENGIKIGFDTLSTTQCAAAGGHHNPFNVSVDATYLRDCNSVTPERCERGDTSSKLSPVSIVPYKPVVYMENNEKKTYGEPEVSKYFLVDNQLSLCGPNSIIGRSVVIHEKHFSMQRISCANILEFKTKN